MEEKLSVYSLGELKRIPLLLHEGIPLTIPDYQLYRPYPIMARVICIRGGFYSGLLAYFALQSQAPVELRRAYSCEAIPQHYY